MTAVAIAKAALPPAAGPRGAAPLLVAEAIRKHWVNERSGAPLVAIDEFSLSVAEGEFISIIGPSGCGKSTFLDIAAGLTTPSAGTVAIAGRQVDGPHPDVGFVFQQDATFPWLTARRNVEFGLEELGVPAPERRARAMAMLELVGLAEFAEHYPDQLSGGMRQRVNIARVLAAKPKIVLMDEPFGALDEQTRLRLGDELLRIWRETRATIILVTHSLSESALLSDRVIVMTPRPGRIRQIVASELPRERSSALIGSAGFSAMTAALWRLLSESDEAAGHAPVPGGH